MEKYLNVNNVNDKKATVKLRGSSHRLNIELGRYKSDPKTNKPPIARENRICNFCFVNDGIRVVEDEKHVIESCAYYDIGRKAFSESLLTLQSAGIIDGFSGTLPNGLTFKNKQVGISRTGLHSKCELKLVLNIMLIYSILIEHFMKSGVSET